MNKGPDIHRRLRNLPLPVIAAPMFLVSGPELVIAACKAGIIGAFPSPNARTVEELDDWLSIICGKLQPLYKEDSNFSVGPWALNVVSHSTNKRLPEDLKLVEKYRPPIVITALGGPAPAIEVVHSDGGLVFADVNSLFYARKAAAVGVDGLILVCAGAGGHTGQLSNVAFVAAVREFFDGYIALAGAVGNGRSILASQVLGADFVAMGTSFIAAKESMAAPEYREMLIASSAEDLVVTKAFTGAAANMLKASIIKQGLDPDEVTKITAKKNFTGRKGEEVKPWKGIYSAGQGVGMIRKEQSVADLVAQLRQEYAQAKRDTAAILHPQLPG